MSEWISVEDRLPENEDSVFIFPRVDFDEGEDRFTAYCIKFDSVDGRFIVGDWIVYDTGGFRVKVRPTHWMPLPEPPEAR